MTSPNVEIPDDGSESKVVPLLELRHVSQSFQVQGPKNGTVSAVSDVSLTLTRGQTLGLVGESGCGKSTLVRSIVQAPRPQEGQVLLDGEDLTLLSGRELRQVRRRMQMVFQDPFASLDPRWKVADLVAEPLVLNKVGTKRERSQRVAELLDLVGLDPGNVSRRRPRQLSGGQAQRVGIARAIALTPEILICDEAVSSLDVSIQAQVLNLLERLRREFDLSYLFVAHDLAVVKHLSDRVAVMYLGKLCELGGADDIYRSPAHPYTASLLAAVPSPDLTHSSSEPARVPPGDIPSPLEPPSGCRYHTRCPQAQERCALIEPDLRDIGTSHRVACHFPLTGTIESAAVAAK